MFGYILPRKPDMKIKEFALYKAVYCSLCRELQKGFGFAAKFLVNYDFVFLALVGMAVNRENPSLTSGRCNTNPFKRQAFIENDEAVRYSAGCLVITSYYKLSDDLGDERFFRKIAAFLLRAALWHSYKKAKKFLPETDACLSENMRFQSAIESEREPLIDKAAEPTAKSLSFMCETLAENSGEKRILARLGYLLGRFIYLSDAGDDLKRDISKKRYNPLIYKHSLASPDDEIIPEITEEIRRQLLLAGSEIAVCYNLLDAGRVRPILDNIIFLGLGDAAAGIGAEKQRRGRSGTNEEVF